MNSIGGAPVVIYTFLFTHTCREFANISVHCTFTIGVEGRREEFMVRHQFSIRKCFMLDG